MRNQIVIGFKRAGSRAWLLLPLVGLVLLTMGLGGCDSTDTCVDLVPPAIPDGVSTITGDGEIWLIWNANREADLAGYRVYSTTKVNAAYEPVDWQLLLEVGTPYPNFPDVYYEPDEQGGRPYLVFIDRSVENSRDYYYAVTAFDVMGNESRMSTDYAVDTPRPEGEVTLSSAAADSSHAAFDFSEGEPTHAGDLVTADVIYDVVDGLPLLFAQTPWVEIQDYGYVDFDVASWAPEFGWATAGWVEAIEGHSYFLQIVDGESLNYAKLFVESVSATQIVLRWAYQPVDSLPELKLPSAGLPPRVSRGEGSS